LGDSRSRDADPRDSRPRVLLLTYNYAPKLGGLEQVVEHVAAALGREVELVVLAQGARGHRDDDPRILRPGREGLVAFVLFLYRRLFSRLPQDGFDVVVSGSALTALPALHFSRRYRAQSVVIIYGLDTIFPSRLYQWIYRYAVSRLDRVIAISRATRAEALARGVDPERVVLIPPGCNGERFDERRETDTLRSRWELEGCRVVLSAGRLVARKGVDRLIAECLTSVVTAVPNTKLLVAGGNPEGALAHTDDFYAEVEAAVRASGLEDRVVITGRLSDDEMVAAFQLANVFVLPVVPTPGDMEGFGIVLLEAGAAGLPVVATAVGGVIDAVEDGATGCLVPAGDYAAMSDAIVRLLTDSELAASYGARGRARALGEYSWPQISRRYVDAILELVPDRDDV
jgi:phosphatidylinositol alpha-1,6-mannosyltransferase